MKKVILFLFLIPFLTTAQDVEQDKKSIKLSDIPKEKLDDFYIEEDKFNFSYDFTSKKNARALNRVYLYVRLKHGIPYLIFCCRYDANTWLFVEKVKFLIDGQVYDYKPLDVYRNTNRHGIIEKMDEVVVRDSTKELIDAIINSKDEITIRFEGDKNYVDQKVKPKAKIHIKETLDFYNYLLTLKDEK